MNIPADSELLDLSARIGEVFRERSLTCGTAESCTGGGVAHALTAIAGSSDYVQGGIVAYSNPIKQRLLGVSAATLDSVGAVSEACCREMAEGARTALGVDLAVSSTGIAGPGGATARKPVGLVYVGVATSEGTQVRELRLSGDRLKIIRASIVAALELVESTLAESALEARESGA